ncbi:hypothetical protein E3P81_01263 [Wallemia ichthyophaga]|nr:hypothetical protein E3P98_01085 [Wallemia ichthyophaga]TIA92829.1 hypothetical protein E3P97_01264 [Wallemia ichthyophaga]TIB34170.1 hypothetical protein E3P85_01013 [Wallemia ichthyophaga]TIB48528.1 hypothetical protein E3P82_01262 [Wallemia ichthyophaga]TIB52582.1 hypothetical protein E3P81_01263 [Wallemia ichthyophaga]
MKFSVTLDAEAVSEWLPGYFAYKHSKKKIKHLSGRVEIKDSVNDINYIISILPPTHRSFFNTLNAELVKINEFYLDRLSDAQTQAALLDSQLIQLRKHRQSFYTQYPRNIYLAFKGAWDTRHIRNFYRVFTRQPPIPPSRAHIQKDNTEGLPDPQGYKKAQRKLKLAVFELHRYLNMLKSFSDLNQVAFYKALKKYDKMAENNIKFGPLYIQQKVNQSEFTTSQDVNYLLDATENVFASYFERGSHRRAAQKLRLESTKRSVTAPLVFTGIFIGLSIPPICMGIHNVYNPTLRENLPTWQALLQAYSACILPPFFLLLFSTNEALLSKARINYVFIFELDFRRYLHPSQVSVLASFLCLLLSWSFYVSFTNSWSETIAPTSWPLIWIIVTLIIWFNPLPFMYRNARYWMIKSLLRVFTAGLLSVQVCAAYFLGDELNSLAYTFSNLRFLGCCYNVKWHEDDTRTYCSNQSSWATPILQSIPATIRLCQCLRRYHDSKYTMRIHLVNTGKYVSVVAQNFAFFGWRYSGKGSYEHYTFIIWIIFSVISSSYTASWDLLMDWSLLQRKSKRRFLRDTLAFEKTYITNTILRFIWLFYLPDHHARYAVRSFIFAVMEVCRRWQWNFYRFENEHVGNVDQYKVVKDVKMPYDEKLSKGSMVDDDAVQAGAAFDLTVEPDSKPANSATTATTEDDDIARLVMTVPRSEQLTEGGARGRPAARDYERRPTVAKRPWAMHRKASDAVEFDFGGDGDGSGSGSGYEDSDFENSLSFSDDSYAYPNDNSRVNKTPYASATSVSNKGKREDGSFR